MKWMVWNQVTRSRNLALQAQTCFLIGCLWELNTEMVKLKPTAKPHDNLRESTVRRSREVWGLRLRLLESSSKAFAKILEDLLQNL